MKKSYWLLFSLAIFCPFMVGVSYIMKQNGLENYKYFAYVSLGALVIFIILAVNELIIILKSLQEK